MGRRELIVLYIDEDNSLHQVLLNDIETKKIGEEITRIFQAKNSDVMVSETKLKIFKEVEKTNGKKDSSNI